MSVHIPIDVSDALVMLDSRIPLTAGERRMIVEGLYNLAFKEGIEAERQRIRKVIDSRLVAFMNPPEYEDPKTTIRRNLSRTEATLG